MNALEQDINYNHNTNLHVLDGPSTIFPIIQSIFKPSSLLDVGCGLGIWLKVAKDNDISDFFGIDGIEVKDNEFYVSKEYFKKCDLRTDWNLRRKFDLILCLEVAEHLPEECSNLLVSSLVAHSDTIIFSAACPHQAGQGHINCQWPTYWQEIFNKHGFTCSDTLRPLIWDMNFNECWYKQNIFVAIKDYRNAGTEDRISSLVHPDLYQAYATQLQELRQCYEALLSGRAGFKNYFRLLLKSLRIYSRKFIDTSCK